MLPRERYGYMFPRERYCQHSDAILDPLSGHASRGGLGLELGVRVRPTLWTCKQGRVRVRVRGQGSAHPLDMQAGEG